MKVEQMLTDEQVESYRRDGVLVLRNVVGGDELRRLQEQCDRLTDEAVAYGRELDASHGPIQLQDDHGFREWDEIDDHNFLYGRGAGGERIWRRAEHIWERAETYRVVSANPRIIGAVERVHGQPVLPANSAIVAKMPGAGAAVPWHRDPHDDPEPGTERDATLDFVCDLYLDPSTVENGCLWAIPGSHRGPATDVDLLDFTVPGAIPLEVEPGDMLFHSTGVLHGSPANTSSMRRRTLYLHYRPESHLAKWGWSPEWIAGRVALKQQMLTERAASGFDAEPAAFGT